jgi:U3 small nucleolar RNA-associated protein 14
MPGRTYTAKGPGTAQPKRKRKQHKRFLDAFSIAQHEVPDKIKIRKNRLGEIEQAPYKRRRDDSYNDDEDDEEENAPSNKRSRRDHVDGISDSGSDGEGNRWVTGRIASDDESSIDSDEAFGDSDEEGPAAKGKEMSKPAQARKIVLGTEDSDAGIDLDEDDDEGLSNDADSDAESEGFAAEAMDLANVLDQRDSESEDEGRTSAKKGPRDQGESNDGDSDWNDGSELSLSEEEEGGIDVESRTKALQDLVTSLDPGKKSNGPRVAPPDAQETMAPSDYGVSSTQKLTIADLLPTVTDAKLRKSLRAIADSALGSKSGGVPQKLEVPLAKRQQDRIDRSAAFEKSKEALGRWIDTVKHNRRSEHLQFPVIDPDVASAMDTSKLQLTSQSRPMTDLESTIQDILFQSGLASHNGKAEEDQIQAYEELATNKMPLEEAQARQAELRKNRALLFREEIKAKRIKKIKSKAYRRVHRKERERNALRDQEALAAAGIEPSDDEQERLHRQRAEERMGAKHRESKWAKAVKHTGRGAWDQDARAGITDMAKREEELRRRIQGKDVNRDDIDSESESSEEEENEAQVASKIRGKLKNLGQEAPARKGLSSLKFMQKAEAAHKARNDADIQKLEREMNGEESPSEESDEGEATGRRSYGPVKEGPLPIARSNKHRNEFEEGSDSEREDHSRNDDTEAENDRRVLSRTQHSATQRTSKGPLSKTPVETKQHPYTVDAPTSQPIENPFLMPPKRPSKQSVTPETVTIVTTQDTSDATQARSQSPLTPKTLGKPAKKVSNKPFQALVNNFTAANIDDDDDDDDTSSSGSEFVDSPPASTLNPIMTNKALMAQAFASDATLDANSFAKEKLSMSKQEAPQDLTPDALPGWGSWTGEGLSKATRKQNARWANAHKTHLSLTGRNKTSEGTATNKRRDAKLEKVIVSEKRVGKNAKYLAGTLPLGFENREQYERSLRVPVGPEWSTKETFQGATKPRVLVKGGVIEAMRKPLL